jgi:hypothetical protein
MYLQAPDQQVLSPAVTESDRHGPGKCVFGVSVCIFRVLIPAPDERLIQ